MHLLDLVCDDENPANAPAGSRNAKNKSSNANYWYTSVASAQRPLQCAQALASMVFVAALRPEHLDALQGPSAHRPASNQEVQVSSTFPFKFGRKRSSHSSWAKNPRRWQAVAESAHQSESKGEWSEVLGVSGGSMAPVPCRL